MTSRITQELKTKFEEFLVVNNCPILTKIKVVENNYDGHITYKVWIEVPLKTSIRSLQAIWQSQQDLRRHFLEVPIVFKIYDPYYDEHPY